jgi:hypothetical protein
LTIDLQTATELLQSGRPDGAPVACGHPRSSRGPPYRMHPNPPAPRLEPSVQTLGEHQQGRIRGHLIGAPGWSSGGLRPSSLVSGTTLPNAPEPSGPSA